MAFTPLVTYKGKSGRGPSPNIWADLPRNINDPNCGVELFDDFINFSDHISDQQTQQYSSYIDTGVTLKQQVGVVNGAVEIAGNDADNDEGVLATHGPIVQVSDTAGDDRKLWFEGRFKKASIADNALAFFLGLAFDHGSGVPITNTLALTDDDGALGAFSYLGFHCDQANGDAIDTVFKAEGQTAVVVQAGAAVPVADTYVKLGFKYDPKDEDAKLIRFFVDNVEQTSFVTRTQLEAATFPDAEPLGLCLVAKTGAAAESKCQLDWWRVAQLAVEG